VRVEVANGAHPDPKRSLCDPAQILVVADDIIVREILLRKLRSQGYLCDFCPDGSAALAILRIRYYDMVLLDIMMPEMGGCALLKDTLKLCPDIATILIAPAVNIDVAVEAVKGGAYDYVIKPFSLEDVTLSVSRALEKRRLLIENREHQRTLEGQVQRRTHQLKEALNVLHQTYHSTLLALGTALDSRDADSSMHSLRVTMYALYLAERLGIGEGQKQVIQQGALLHDIGKIGIPDALLRKPGKLSEHEWVLMRKHPGIGFRILSGIKFLREAAELVLHHHERYDGTGYPNGLRGSEISLGARIFAVADTLDCMTSDRPFKAATDFTSAYREILNVSGTQLDPWVVYEFSKIPLQEWQRIRGAVSPSALPSG
jgi:putative nucleotidyltransferase with HDIG domain